VPAGLAREVDGNQIQIPVTHLMIIVTNGNTCTVEHQGIEESRLDCMGFISEIDENY
jgi:hypothetical protein